MQLKIRVLVFICAIFSVVFCACKNNDLDEKLAEEEQKLAEYIRETYGDAAIDLKGGAYLVKNQKEDEGATIEAGNYIFWNWKKTNQITDELEYTSDLTNDKFPGSYVDGGPEMTLVQSSFKIDEGLKLMRKGEKGDIFIPSRWLLYDFQPRIYSVEIVDVIKNLSVYQDSLMYKFIRRNHRGASPDTIKVISTVDKTEYKVMYHICKDGSGDKITADMNVETQTSISYLLRMTRDGNAYPYQMNQDVTWNTGVNNKKTLTDINCIGEILKKMRKGGEVEVAMPAKLYWEDKDLPMKNEQFIVPKGAVIIFTITINKPSEKSFT